MKKWIFVVCAALILAACSQDQMLQKFASKADQATAKHYLSLLQQGQVAELEDAIDPSLQDGNLDAAMQKMALLMPSGKPDSMKLVGAHKYLGSDSTKVDLAYEYNFSGKWVIANVALKKVGSKVTIIGMHVVRMPESLEEQNAFSLSGKTPLEYTIFALVIVLPLFTLYALVVCIRTPLKGKKWPWVIFIILGIGTFSINWATGQLQIRPIAVQLFSGSFFAELYGPWVLSVSIPLGAIIFLLRRNNMVRLEGPPTEPSPAEPPAVVPNDPGSGESLAND